MEQNINADHNNDILLIFAVLRGITRRWTTMSEIQNRLASQGLDIHRRTLQRVLKRIVNHPELGVELDDRTRVYAYRQTVPSGSFSAMQMNPQECLLLRLFEENMRYLLPGSLMNAMEPLFETARATLRERAPETPERTWLSKVASVPSGVKFIPPEIKPRIFDAVSEALYREVKLEVRYRNLEGVEKEAIVSPLGLVLQDRKVYVVVRFDGYDNCRHLANSRRTSPKIFRSTSTCKAATSTTATARRCGSSSNSRTATRRRCWTNRPSRATRSSKNSRTASGASKRRPTTRVCSRAGSAAGPTGTSGSSKKSPWTERFVGGQWVRHSPALEWMQRVLRKRKKKNDREKND